MKTFKVGTLNVQGCRDIEKRRTICEDALQYDLQVLGITETHIKETDIEDITVTVENKTRTYKVFHGGIEDENIFSGTGILIETSLNPRFQRISDRISTASFKINKDHNIHIVVAYAPTLKRSEDNPQLREEFYDALNKAVKDQKKNKHLLLVLGDLNAKTGSGHRRFPENIGKYGKGQLNKNGEYLLEFAKENELILSNTLFPHKLAHRTTWISKERINAHRHSDGSIRRNPYRNQIDYVLIKRIHRVMVRDSRSYSGLTTSTDHKLVKTTIGLNWWKMKTKRSKSEIINTHKLNNNQIKSNFVNQLENKINQVSTESESPDETWKRIANTCKEVAKEVLGVREQNAKIHRSPIIQELSEKQKKLRDDAESTINKEKRKEIRKERNQTLRRIKDLIREEENNKLEKEIENIEKYKDDSNKYYQAIRSINSKKPKKPLIIYDEKNKLVASEKEQIDIVTKFFQNLFTSNEPDETPEIQPLKMEPPFNAEEMKRAAKKLKNNKSTGRDEIKAEYLKYGPDIIHKQVAELLNKTSETGDYPEEIRRGILTPLAKPPKKKEKVNVRPIILLSVLRKIITITLIDRCWDRIKQHIPPSQAAYQGGRSTTEQVFTLKTMAEKAITSENYQIFFLLLDMSKAFDTVNRPKLLNQLAQILTKSELFMLHLLINDVILNVRIGKNIGKDILTEAGICQGDCLSALLFIFYLAKAMKPFPIRTEREDHKEPLWSDLDWLISKDKHEVEIDPKYADDISFIRSHESKINQVERIIPPMLKDSHLIINESKTERYTISRDSDKCWRKCKYLGSLLNTEDDIARRKGLLIDAFRTLESIFKSQKVSENIKIRIFKTYLESIFLYNSELWTLTKSLENAVDSFQRKQLRRTLGIFWPRIITNKVLYERTKQQPWSVTICKRRLRWCGHLLRLPPITPARLALEKFVTPVQKPVGRPKTTWLSIIVNDIKNHSDIVLGGNEKECIDLLENLCSDRKGWNKTVSSIMLSRMTNMH